VLEKDKRGNTENRMIEAKVSKRHIIENWQKKGKMKKIHITFKNVWLTLD
jgi:hypothetical protein